MDLGYVFQGCISLNPFPLSKDCANKMHYSQVCKSLPNCLYSQRASQVSLTNVNLFLSQDQMLSKSSAQPLPPSSGKRKKLTHFTFLKITNIIKYQGSALFSNC